MKKDKLKFDDIFIMIGTFAFLFGRIVLYLSRIPDYNWVKQYLQPLLVYTKYYDAGAVLMLLAVCYSLIQENKNKRVSICFFLNLLNTLPCWSYIPHILGWTRDRIVNVMLSFVSWISESDRHVLYFLFTVLVTGTLYCLIRHRKMVNKYSEKLKRHIKTYPVLWVIFAVLFAFSVFHLSEMIGYLFGFDTARIQQVILKFQIPEMMISLGSLIYMGWTLFRCVKKTGDCSPVIVFLNVCMSVRGVYTAVNLAKEIPIKTCILAEVKFFAGAGVLAGGILLSSVLIKTIITIWKENIVSRLFERVRKGFSARDANSKLAICVTGIVSMVICVAIAVVLVRWGITWNSQFEEISQLSYMGKISTYFVVVLIFLVITMLAMIEMTNFVWHSVKEMLDDRKDPMHWVILLAAAVLTGLSIYFYQKAGLDDWDYMNLAGNVFGVFAMPVILMAWYAIMKGLLGSFISNIENDDIKKEIGKEMTNLILMLIRSVFAPFYFVVSFIDTIRDAIIDSEQSEEDDENNKYEEEKQNG